MKTGGVQASEVCSWLFQTRLILLILGRRVKRQFVHWVDVHCASAYTGRVKIAFVCQSYPPMVSGAALVVARLAEGLAARGHAVLVLAASDKGQPYTEVRNGLRVARLRAWPNPFRVGQRFLLWPQTEIDSELRAFQPDVIHLEDFGSAGLAGLRTGRALHRPVVLTLHQLPWFVSSYLPNVPGLRRAAEAWLWNHLRGFTRQCTAVITPSAMIADIAARRLPARPTPITNGVALERFSPQPARADEAATLRAHYQLDPQLPIILFAGRLDADKKVDLVLRAAAEVLRAQPAQVLIAGDGKLRGALQNLCVELGLQSAVRFPGYVSASGDLPGLYRLASAFVTASEVEIQSSVVLEAQASGTPVVTVRASSMAEFVEDGVTGFLAPPGDVTALAGRLLEVLRLSPSAREALRRAALASASAHSTETALREHERAYQRLLIKRDE